jgi:hypothetical protein
MNNNRNNNRRKSEKGFIGSSELRDGNSITICLKAEEV